MNNCLDALALSDEELLSIASDDRTLPAEEQEHLAQCPTCQQRLATYTNTRNRLLAKLYRSICPTAIELNYYCIGMIPEQKRISIASHILDCPLCTDEVAEIRKVQASVDLFPTLAPSLNTRIRRIFATPVAPQMQLVMRGNTSATGWPRHYRAESIDLSLRLSRASNRDIVLLGIISRNDSEEQLGAFEGVRAELYASPASSIVTSESGSSNEQNATPLQSTQVDKIGNMVFRPVSMGNYILIIHLPDCEVVIEGITIEHK